MCIFGVIPEGQLMVYIRQIKSEKEKLVYPENFGYQMQFFKSNEQNISRLQKVPMFLQIWNSQHL
jgi:hypothetical protein